MSERRPPERRRRPVLRSGLLAAVIVATLAMAGSAVPASAQDDADTASDETLVYAVRILEPFVVERPDGSLGGFSVDLARELALIDGRAIDFVIVDSVGEQIAAVENGDADAAIGAISITAERETRVDFSQPMYDSGIQIATPASSDRISLRNIIGQLFAANVLLLLVAVAGAAVVTGTIVWLIERRRNEEFEPAGWRGVFSGIWWATVTLFTIGYGDQVPRRIASRLIAMAWMLMGVLLVATLTAEVAANLTVERIDNDIEDVGDLAGRTVLTIEGTTSDDFLRSNGVRARAAADPLSAVRELESGDADAFVYDAAIIRYLAAETGSIRLAGGALQPESYGIVLPEGSPLVEPIDRALLTVRENGTYARLDAAYFG